MTDLGTQTAQAALTLGTVNVDRALEVAETSLTLVVGQTVSCRALGGDPHTALLGGGNSSKPLWAGAVHLLVDDVAESVGSAGSLLLAGVDTLEVDADLVTGAVLVVSAPDTAHPVAAHLAGWALLAGDAGDEAHLLAALLPHQAVRLAPAGEPAGPALAGGAALAVAVSPAALAVSDAGPLVQGAGDEALQALTDGLSVPDVALGVWTAGIKADVLAAPADTETFVRAVTVSSWAASLGETASLVGVSHLTLRTETAEPCGCGPAAGGAVAGLAAAGVQGGAAALGYRVRSGPGRAGTLRSLLLRQADSVHPTGVLAADVHAGEAQPVAELAGRTVRVGQTADSPAANHGVGGVSLELARGAGAAGGVVLGDADSLGTAGDGGAGGDTFLQRGAAHLFLPALGVRLALVLGDESTASPVPGVSSVALETDTGALVVAGPALRVRRAGEQLADWSAAENSQGVRLTHLVRTTLGISPAGGY